jgi:2-succinyl-5-enolpyruvyl-6-hydroxy-3-cyclohexene-1-carboxylate synthase
LDAIHIPYKQQTTTSNKQTSKQANKQQQQQQQATNKQSTNQSGPMEYNCGVRLPLQTEILERTQSNAMGMNVDAPWYVPNTVIRGDPQT